MGYSILICQFSLMSVLHAFSTKHHLDVILLWIQETHYKVNNAFASNLPYLQSLDPDTSRLETYSFCTFSN
jgi:hypothetical protein